jgi:hypothetical protein
MPGIRRAALLAASLCVSSTALADDPYADYRIPDHHWLSWTVAASGGGSHQRGQGSTFGFVNSGSFGGSGGTSISGGYDSDALLRSYSLSVSGNGSRDYSSGEQFDGFSSSEQLRRDQRARETVSASASITTYPWSVPLGLTSSLSHSLSLEQSWTSTSSIATISQARQRSLTGANDASGRYNVYVTATLGTGLGRIRDATPVYQVQILEQRLLGTGALTRELSTGAREKLAALYTIESSLAFAHQRPTKYFWRELERVLREDGALATGSLDAWSVQRLLEPLAFTGSSARPRGFFVGPLVIVTTQRYHASAGSGYASALFLDDTLAASTASPFTRRRTNQRADAILTGFSAEYHRPVGLHWQTDAFSRAALTESGERLFTNTVASVSWFIADRWVFTTGVGHSGEAPGHRLDRRLSRWAFGYSASLDYFLEDDWSLRLGTDLRQNRDFAYSRSESFSLGVSYRLAGLLSAPGLMETARLTPPSH